MGACCSAPDGDTGPPPAPIAAPAPIAVDPAAERERWLRKIEDLRTLLATTAAHVERDGGGAIIPHVEEWAAAQRAVAEGKYTFCIHKYRCINGNPSFFDRKSPSSNTAPPHHSKFISQAHP